MNLIKTRNQIHVGTYQCLNGLYQAEKFVLVSPRTELTMKERKGGMFIGKQFKGRGFSVMPVSNWFFCYRWE